MSEAAAGRPPKRPRRGLAARLRRSARKRIVAGLGAAFARFGLALDVYPLTRTGDEGADAALPSDVAGLPRARAAMAKLLRDHAFETVLDVGSGEGAHARVFRAHGKTVTALDFGTSLYFEKAAAHDEAPIVGDFLALPEDRRWDCVWASHVLEHQPDPGRFLAKCRALLAPEGVLAITVPPLKHQIVGGHLTLWNAGLLLYQLCFAGFDCREAEIRSEGNDVSVILRNRARPEVPLDYDTGDVARLAPWLPPFCEEGFDGRVARWNW